MNPLRSVILAAARNETIKRTVATAPVSRDVVARFVAGENTADAIRATTEITGDGRLVTLDYLGEDSVDTERAERTVTAYTTLLDQLGAAGLAANAEVSVKLSAVGAKFDRLYAYKAVSRICKAAEAVGTAVTLDMEDRTTTDDTLNMLVLLRQKWPSTGVVVQAYLKRTLEDCEQLAEQGARVRLCKGAYAEPATVAYTSAEEVSRNYIRCADALLGGEGYPMFATHDPALLGILGERVAQHGRTPDRFEYQMLYGVRPDEQRKLRAEGNTVRVYVPYGEQWYGYLMRRLAERPANVGFFGRALLSKR
ncbi:proline dehydrogenase family protein [Sciscionella sediminilitoris]|uniref:proline dehydrogenase family protein n=1 Tax=Sciscionella sediminilitoris TaxID=1445613 RepID=UPI0004DEFAD6|nr:proline dehydrogenase family protein [Sciscionella sp. SE31]